MRAQRGANRRRSRCPTTAKCPTTRNYRSVEVSGLEPPTSTLRNSNDPPSPTSANDDSPSSPADSD
jgi:hypothetical protein